MLVINFNHCQIDIEESEKTYHKVVYQVKVIESNNSEFNSKYIKFKIVKVNNITDYKYKGLKGYVFIKPVQYNQLLQQADLSRLEGVQLEITGNFSKVKSISNPGDKSRIPLYLANKSLGKLDFSQVDLVNSDRNSLNNVLFSVKHQWISKREQIQELIKNQSSKLYQGDAYSLLMAMILGDKESLDYSVERGLQKTGTSHIIAISGLHIGMLYLLLSTLINVLTKNIRLKFYLVVTCLIAYHLLIGHNVSAIRATVMIIVYLYSFTFYRCYKKEKSLFLCLILYLLVYPEGIFSGGFLLSYGAVIGLFSIYPVLKRYFTKKSKDIYDLSAGGLIIDLALISISVNITTLPILIYLFNGISIVSVVANVFIVPVIMSFYTLGLINLLVSVFSYKVAFFMSGTVEIVSNYIVGIGSLLGDLPFSFKYIKTPNILMVVLYYLIIYLLIKKHKLNELEEAIEVNVR